MTLRLDTNDNPTIMAVLETLGRLQSLQATDNPFDDLLGVVERITDLMDDVTYTDMTQNMLRVLNLPEQKKRSLLVEIAANAMKGLIDLELVDSEPRPLGFAIEVPAPEAKPQ